MGAARVKVANIRANRLALELRGAADVNVESLDAERLDVDLPSAGKISVVGRVAEQPPTMATLEGLGSATVWAVEELDATIRVLAACRIMVRQKSARRSPALEV